MLIERLRRGGNWYAISVLALLTLAIWLQALRSTDRSFTVVFLDVGQGDCIFLRTPSGKTMLVDGGGRRGSSDTDSIGLRLVEPFLRSRGVNRVDVVVLSHPHDDHVQGLIPVIRDFPVGMVLDPGIPHGSESYAEFVALVEERKIPYRQAIRGQRLDFGDGVCVHVLSPPSDGIESSDDYANANSAVLRITCGDHALMLMGDAGMDTEQEILRLGIPVRADVLKVGHHGSNTATSEEWLAAVQPSCAVISVGRSNPFGHPATDVLERCSSAGVRVYRTDRHGAITVRFAGRKVSIKASLPIRGG